MSFKYSIPFILFILLWVYIFFRVYTKDKPWSFAGSTHLVEDDSACAVRTHHPPQNDGSLDNLIQAIAKNNIQDQSAQFSLDTRIVKDCTEETFQAEGHALTYKTCLKKGPWWSQLIFNEQVLTQANIKSLHDRGNSPSDEFNGYNPNFQHVQMLNLQGKKYWVLAGKHLGCQGNGCLWTSFLLFDLQHYQMYHFLGFQIKEGSNFMDLNLDGQIDYLGLSFIYTYTGDNLQDPNEANTLIIRAWTLNSEGDFVEMKGSDGRHYQITAQFDGGLFGAYNTEITQKYWMNSIDFPVF